MKLFGWLLLFVFPLCINAQNNSFDSLTNVVALMKEDTAKTLQLVTLSNKCRVEKVDYPKAKQYADNALALSDKLSFEKGRFMALVALGYLYRDQGLKTDGIAMLNKALLVFEGSKTLVNNAAMHSSHVNTCTAIAEVYTQLPDFASAQKYAFRALELSDRYKVQAGQCWITLSIIFSRQKNIGEARKYALKALDYFTTTKASGDVARVCSFLGSYAFMEGDNTKALSWYHQAYDAYKSVNSLYGMRISLYNLSDVYLKMKDYRNANEYIAQTFKITTDTDIISMFHINQLLFNIKYDQADYATAVKVANTSVNYALKEKSLRNISAAYSSLLQALLAVKDTIAAYAISEKISSLKDSLYNADMAKSAATLAKKYETEKKEQQIILLHNENELNREKLLHEKTYSLLLTKENILKEEKISREKLLREALTRENNLKKNELVQEKKLLQTLQQQNHLMTLNSRNEQWIRWMMVIALLALGGLGFNYYRSYYRQKESNKKITAQSEALKTLMKELHHRVKNNLQVIMSMLRMQARVTGNVETLDSLQKAEQRLQAIAMVHEKLYRSQDTGSILLKDYISGLMEMLARQYQELVPNFNYTITDEAHLSVIQDTAIPLGLIINELVTNAFKYAFAQVQQPEICILLNKIDDKQYQLAVKDNGIGLPNGRLPVKPATLGLKLVGLLTEQLNGTLEYTYTNGASFTIIFSPITSTI